MVAIITANEIIDTFTTCRREKTKSMNGCFGDVMKAVVPHKFTMGIPDLGVPPLEPFNASYMDLSMNQPPNLVFKLKTGKAEVKGASKANIWRSQTNVKAGIYTMGLSLPQLRGNGQYNMMGDVLGMTINGTGTFWLLINNVNCTSVLNVRYDEGKKQLVIPGGRFNCKFRGGRVRVNDVLGNEDLSDAVNSVINENFNDFSQVAMPEVGRIFQRHLNKYLGGLFEAIPSDVASEWKTYDNNDKSIHGFKIEALKL